MIITGHNGNHNIYKFDRDVKLIYIHDTNTKFIPKNLGLLFNITGFSMVYTQLFEFKVQDFYGMENLEYLHLERNKLNFVPLDSFNILMKLKLINLGFNQIQELPNGLFDKNINLERVLLYGNNIKFLGSILFDGLTKLNHVNLVSNICINQIYPSTTSITELKNDIKLKCKSLNDSVDVKLIEIDEKINLILKFLSRKENKNKRFDLE